MPLIPQTSNPLIQSINECDIAIIMRLNAFWLLPSLATACLVITVDFTASTLSSADTNAQPYTIWDVVVIDDLNTVCNVTDWMVEGTPGPQLTVPCHGPHPFKITPNAANWAAPLWFEYDSPSLTPTTNTFWSSTPIKSCPNDKCRKCRNHL
jgi:hypothetical protein